MDNDTNGGGVAIESTQLLDAAREMARAIAFFDRVQASSEEERQAVGRDHYDWVFRAARKVAEASNDMLTVSGGPVERHE